MPSRVFSLGVKAVGQAPSSMAASIEMRLPLVDQQLLETVAAVPDDTRFHPVRSKAMLRRAGLRGLDPALFEQTPLKLYENPLYIAFSKDVSDETIQRWQKALDKVKREKYSQLDHKYLH